MMNHCQDSVNLLKKLNFMDASENGRGSLEIDLQYKNRFNKGFIYLGIDNKKLCFAKIAGLTVSATAENIEKINKINDIMNELLKDACAMKWLGR